MTKINPDLVIPDFLKRLERGADKKVREMSEYERERRAAHATAMHCRLLNEKDRKRRKRKKRAT